MPVIGTAGHVDHGKSTLVQALTGRDPDRWAEEKARGLTIDLGFAWTTLDDGNEISFVDVPGHEKFIKNMLAGTDGFDVALFVVAADEGWMPQSEEHLAVLDLLGVGHAVVALTKIDRVDEDLVELAALEIEEKLAGTTLASGADRRRVRACEPGARQTAGGPDRGRRCIPERRVWSAAAVGRPRLHDLGSRYGGHGHIDGRAAQRGRSNRAPPWAFGRTNSITAIPRIRPPNRLPGEQGGGEHRRPRTPGHRARCHARQTRRLDSQRPHPRHSSPRPLRRRRPHEPRRLSPAPRRRRLAGEAAGGRPPGRRHRGGDPHRVATGSGADG